MPPKNIVNFWRKQQSGHRFTAQEMQAILDRIMRERRDARRKGSKPQKYVARPYPKKKK